MLIACEFSGRVRQAFRERGHDAFSCDLLPALDDSPHHIRGDVLKVIGQEWDMLIAFPPCTHLAASGARWWQARRAQQEEALDFVRLLLYSRPIPKIALENPIGCISTHIRKPDQIIQPWQFGHGETKSTCLWLKGLPPLQPTNIVEGRENKIWLAPDSKGRSLKRSLTYPGIAQAMAEQWG